MKLESQVCSFDLAKRLKELGVKQDSLFYYQNNPYNDGEECIDLMIVEEFSKNNENLIINTECENDDNPKYSAFTVAELGKMLPKSLWTPTSENLMHCRPANRLGFWCVVYNTKVWTEEKTEADARAQMLIYLLEQGLIKND